jgi:hypothetical protein
MAGAVDVDRWVERCAVVCIAAGVVIIVMLVVGAVG